MSNFDLKKAEFQIDIRVVIFKTRNTKAKVYKVNIKQKTRCEYNLFTPRMCVMEFVLTVMLNIAALLWKLRGFLSCQTVNSLM